MQQALALRVVYALKGWFRQETPPWQEDLSAGQDSAEGVLRHCIDSRMVSSKVLHLAPGEVFDTASAGAVIPPWNGGEGIAVQTATDIGYPIKNFAISSVFIKGHTHCGAVGALYGMMRGSVPTDIPEAQWLMPMLQGDDQAIRVIQNTDDKRRDQMLRWLEEYMVLKSMDNLYGYVFGGRNVHESVASGELLVAGGIRGLEKSQSGQYPLSVFDPDTCAFTPIERIYDDAGQPDLTVMEKAGSWRRYVQEQEITVVMTRGAQQQALGTIAVMELRSRVERTVERGWAI